MADFAERARRGITRCSDADLPELRAFQALNYGSRASELATTHLDWLCSTNPYRSPDGLGVWIARRNGRIVGQQAEIAFGLRVGGEELRAAVPTELMVDTAWRLRGVGPALSREMCQASRIACAFLMTDDASRMYARAGWADLGEIPRYVLPLGSMATTNRGMTARGGIRPTVTRSALALVSSAEILAARLRTSKTQLVPVDEFDDGAQTIWEQEATTYPVLACRTTRDLRWRFDKCPYASTYRRFYLVRAGRPVGYVVLRVRTWRGHPALRIVDYLTRPSCVGTLFAHCVVLAKREGHEMIELLTRNSAARLQIHSLGFIRSRPRPQARLMVAIADNDPLRRHVMDPESWFVTASDSDEELVNRRQAHPFRPLG